MLSRSCERVAKILGCIVVHTILYTVDVGVSIANDITLIVAYKRRSSSDAFSYDLHHKRFLSTLLFTTKFKIYVFTSPRAPVALLRYGDDLARIKVQQVRSFSSISLDGGLIYSLWQKVTKNPSFLIGRQIFRLAGSGVQWMATIRSCALKSI